MAPIQEVNAPGANRSRISVPASGAHSGLLVNFRWLLFWSPGPCGCRVVVFPCSRSAGEQRRRRSTGAPDSRGPGGRHGVPVVVATAHRGDLPMYFNGLGNVTAFNTVTVRSRVDGQIVKINFTEGQNVKEGDALIEIDPRPFQVQLEQAEGQLAKDQAQLKDMQVDYERYQLLFKEGVIPEAAVRHPASASGNLRRRHQGGQSDHRQRQTADHLFPYHRSHQRTSGLATGGHRQHCSCHRHNRLLVITQLQPIAVLFSLPQDQLPKWWPECVPADN